MNIIKTIPSIDLDQVTGGKNCFSVAKREAVKFDARQNGVDPRSIGVVSAKAFGREDGRQWYGVQTDTPGTINIGLKPDCSAPVANYGILD